MSSSDLLKEISGADEFQQSPGENSNGRREYEEFLEESLRRLEITLSEAVREQQAWEAEREEKQGQLEELAAELERRHQEIESQRERFFEVMLPAALEKFQERVEQLAERIVPADAAGAAEAESRLEKILEERAEILQSRAVLEAELETLRQRAADLMGTLEEQKLAAAQQNQLGEELRRQRQMLELLLQRTAELESIAAENKTREKVAAGSEDSALSSVLSQFEVLQKDIARRRSKTLG